MFCTIFCDFSYLDRFTAFTRLHMCYIVWYNNVYPSDVHIFSKFLPLYFYMQKKKILHISHFVKLILSYHFTTMFIGHTCKNFSSFFSLYFYKKKFFVQFLFSCKFSWDQFYSFTCTIHLYRFLLHCSSVTRAIF